MGLEASGGDCIMRSFFIFTFHKIFVFRPRMVRWAGTWHACVRRGVYTGFCWGNLRERDHSEDTGIDGRIILKWNFKKYYGSG